ncbi:hypothetical protein [Nitrosomonas ureae]|uniref:hypothetical protein n=1 Tax=Nitrosomonas ureae TaxID=44577 RepID=UPI001E5DEBCD|nr:hypothetical protein [Nitrosomonas ureae]
MDFKQLEDLSDEAVVLQRKRNPYYQAFSGMMEFQRNCLAAVRNWCIIVNDWRCRS